MVGFNDMIGSIKTKEKWIEEIQKQIIKYYGIEILKLRINIKYHEGFLLYIPKPFYTI